MARSHELSFHLPKQLSVRACFWTPSYIAWTLLQPWELSPFTPIWTAGTRELYPWSLCFAGSL